MGQSINFQEDVNKLEGLSIESQEYEEIIEELKKSVCNKVVVVIVVIVVVVVVVVELVVVVVVVVVKRQYQRALNTAKIAHFLV